MRRKILILLAAMVAVLIVPLGASSPASASTCSDPRFVTSGTNGMWSNGGYVVHNNMWNAVGLQRPRDPVRVLLQELARGRDGEQP